MSCQIKKQNNKIVEVLAPNGAVSILWKSINSLPFLTEEEKENIYVAAQDIKNSAVSDENGEPILLVEEVDSNVITNGLVLSKNVFETIKNNKEKSSYSVGFSSGKTIDELPKSNKTTKVRRTVEYINGVNNSQSEIISFEDKVVIKEGKKNFVQAFKINPSNKTTMGGFIIDKIQKGIIKENVEKEILAEETIVQPTTNEITIQQAIQRNNGNPLTLAPNGNPSILYQSYKDLGYSDSEAERLVAQTFSDNFISWFGIFFTSEKDIKNNLDNIIKELNIDKYGC